MKIQKFLFYLLTCITLSAQTAHNTNFGIKSRVIIAGIVADGNYSASSLNLPFVDWTGWGNPTTTLGQTLYGYSSLMQTALDYAAGNYREVDQNISKLSSAINVSAGSIYMFTFFAIAVLDIARSYNTSFRVYQVYVPVSANYTITANLVGDFDRPHNKLDIYKDNTNIFHKDEYLSSSRSMAYQVNLFPGNYTIVVGLGSGSTFLHTAGTLSSVTAVGNFNWIVPSVVTEKRFSFVQTLPTIGSSSNISVSLSSAIQPGVAYPINFGVGTVRYTGFRAGDAILDPCKAPDTVLSRVANGVWFGDMSSSVISYDNFSNTAIFRVSRYEDVPWSGNSDYY